MTQFDYRGFRRDWESLLASENYIECEALCQECLQQNPSNKHRSKLYNHLGFIYENYLDDKTFDDILEHYVLALQVDEDNASAHYNLSNFLLEQGMQHLLRALELKPKHVKAKQKLALLQPIKHGDLIKIRPLSADDTTETDSADYTRAYICDDVTGEGIECSEVLYKQSEGKYVKRATDLRSKSARRDIREMVTPGMISTLLGQGLEKTIQDFLLDLKQELPAASDMSAMDVDSTASRTGHKRKKSSRGGGMMIGTQNSIDAGERDSSANLHSRNRSVMDEDGPVVSVRRGGKTTHKSDYGDNEGKPPRRRDDDSGVIGGTSKLSDTDIASGCCDCCQWCIPLMYYWCIWLTLVLLSFGGIGFYGYGYYFKRDCEKKIESDQTALFESGGGSTLNLDVLVLADCTENNGASNDTWNDQITAISAFLSAINNDEGTSMSVAYGQSCGNVRGSNNVVITDEFADYVDFTANTLGDPQTNESSPLSDEYFLSDVMDLCYMTHNTREETSKSPFLCVPAMATQPSDLIDTVISANEMSERASDTLLVFLPITDSEATEDNMLNFLGTVGLTTDQCSEDDLNSWWSATFEDECGLSNAESTSDACAHCIPSENNVDCQTGNLIDLLKGDELYSESFTLNSNDKICELDVIYEYGLAGVVPLLIYAVIALINACCVTCCVSDNDTVRAMTNHRNL